MNDTLSTLLSRQSTRSKAGDSLGEPSSTTRATPPFDDEAEKAILGAIILRNEVLDEIMDDLNAKDFYRGAHQRLYSAMYQMRMTSEPIDQITLRDYLDKHGQLEGVGGVPYILDLADIGTTAYNPKKYSAIVRDCSKYRRIIEIGSSMMAAGYDGMRPDATADDVVSDAMSMVTSLALAHQSSAIPVDAVFQDVLKQMRTGVHHSFSPPGMPESSMEPGDLVVVAAGTSAGKTALTLDWCDEWSKTKQITFFEYEMPESALASRLICKYAGIDFRSLREGSLNEEEQERVEDAVKTLNSRKLKLESVWCDIGQLMAKIRREAQLGAEVVVIDHIGLVPFRIPKGMNEASAIGKCVSSPLKRLASELSITIIILVQLNRDGQQPGQFPQKRHLKSSGDLENDAAVIYMLWSEASIMDSRGERIKKREESGLYADPMMLEDGTWAVRVACEKQRNGPLFAHWVKYIGNRFTYEWPKEIDVLNLTQMSMN